MYQLRRLQAFLYNSVAKFADKLGLFDLFYLKSLSRLEGRQGKIYILIVCQGNICRSPYATHILKAALPEAKFEIHSAGLDTHTGKPADEAAIRIAQTRGTDLSQHSTTPCSDELLAKADLIIGMEPVHLEKVRARGSQFREKCILLGAAAVPQGGDLLICDPYGLPDAHFERCFDLVDLAAVELVKRLS